MVANPDSVLSTALAAPVHVADYMRRTILIMLCSTAAAMAQSSRFDFHVGGGFTQPVYGVESRLDRGWNVLAGGGINFTPHVGLVGEFMFNRFGISQSALSTLNMPGGNTRVWAVTVDPIVHFHPQGAMDFYLIGGGGVYHRNVEFTRPTVQTITIFDPWWGIAYPANVAADQILSSYGTTKAGVNGGGGVSFRLGKDTKARVFAEARYHHMFTRDVRTTMLPVTFGIRW
jgi:hypothetical protein